MSVFIQQQIILNTWYSVRRFKFILFFSTEEEKNHQTYQRFRGKETRGSTSCVTHVAQRNGLLAQLT